MDHKTFISGLARQLGKEPKEVDNLIEALTDVMKNSLCDLDAVAIPGFGRFDPVKKEEYIAIDNTDGITKLFPPEVSLTFTPGTMLKKRLTHE